jgi:MFS family permease
MAAIVSWKSLKNAHLISDAPSDEIVEEAARISTLRQAIKQRAYRAAVAVNFSTGFVRFGLLSALAPLFVVEALKANAGLASTGFLFSAAGQALLLSRAGRWTDDKGRKPVMLIGGTLTVTGLVLLAFYETIPGYFIAMLILGASGAFMSSAPTAVVGDVTGGKPRGQVLSTYQMSSDFGAIFGPLAAGWLLDASGVFSTPLLIAAALMMVVIYLVWAMPETKPQEVERS